MSNDGMIITPGSAPRMQQMGPVRTAPGDNGPRFNLPQEMKDEVKKHVPEAKELAAKVHEFLIKGPAAQVAFVCQEPIRMFLGGHVRTLLPQMARAFAQNDRMQVLSFFQQMCAQRTSPANLAAEKIDKRTYELAVADFMSLIARVPAQVVPVEIGLPDVDLESPANEAPSADTPPQGET